LQSKRGVVLVLVHPTFFFWQHQVFLLVDHPSAQFAYPALQSNGSEVVK
jgi:hypothetical protein